MLFPEGELKVNQKNRLRILLLAMTLAMLMSGLVTQIASAEGHPVQASPPDGSTQSLRPTVSWYSSGASTYGPQIAEDPRFYGPITPPTNWIGGLSFTPEYDLSPNRLYYWRVKASNYSDPNPPVRHFFTPVNLSSPAEGASVSLTPTLSWAGYTIKVGATPDVYHVATPTYRIQVASDSGFGSVVVDSTATTASFVVPSSVLLIGHSYYWRTKVLAADDTTGWSGESDWSASRSFATPPAPPEAPVLLSPSNGSTTNNWKPTLSWNPVAGASWYNLRYTVDGWAHTTTVSTLHTTSYSIGFNLAAGVTGEWNVEAVNGNGYAASDSWSFSTPPSDSIPGTPSLLSPYNQIGTPVGSFTPTFTWTSTTYTKYYKIEVGTTPNPGSGLVRNANVDYPATSFPLDVTLDWNTQYYWKVTAFGYGSNSASAVWSFKTPSPPGPTLSTPDNGSTLTSRRPTFAWTPVVGATNYRVQVATADSFASPLVVDASVDPAVASAYTMTTDLDYDVAYFWRVRFTDSRGNSEWSSTWNFRGPPPPIPFVPTALSPGSATGGSIVGFRPTFDWSDSAGATSYGFELATNPALGSDGKFASSTVSLTGMAQSTYSTTTDLAPSTTFYWHANAANSTGTSDWTPVFSLATPPPPPVAPSLLAPSNGTIVLTLRPHFDWSDNLATTYDFELYSDALMTTPVASASPTASEYDLSADLLPGTTYYWHARGRTVASGNGAWSAPSVFTTPVSPPPAVPTLLAPANGATVDTLSPTVDWQDDPNSGSYSFTYRVQLSESSSFGTTVVNEIAPASVYVRPTWAELRPGTQYFWRIQGINSAAPPVTSAWSEVRSFFTPNAPAVPTLSLPAAGATVDTATPTLVVNPVAEATEYTVEVSTASWYSSATIVRRVSSSTPSLTVAQPLSYSTTYYWHASAKNAAGTSDWTTESRAFTTPLPPAKPVPPTPLLPVNGSTVGSARPTLDWNDVAGATSYEVAWGKSSTMAWTEANRPNLTESNFTLDVDLLFNTDYFWRVRAKGEGGTGDWSTVFGFKTPSGPPSLPELLAPANSSTAGSPSQTMDWSNSTAAESYQIQLSTDPAMASPVIDTTVAVSEFTPVSNLPTGAVYFWRVKAINGVGASEWTLPWSYAIPAAPTGEPGLLLPDDGATVDSLKPTLTWSAVDGAAHYEVKYSPSPTFGWGVTTEVADSASHQLQVKLPLDKDYYWKVTAYNGGGYGPTSAVRRFHTPATPPPATEPPVAPVLTGPADGAYLTTAAPQFTWGPAEGATGYHLQVSRDSTFALTNMLANANVTDTTSYTLPFNLDYSTQFYWRVNAYNSIGTTNAAFRSFTTPAPPPPPAPVLLSPAPGGTTIDLAPAYDWADSTGATGYRIQVATDTGFKTLISSATIAGTTSNYTMPTWKSLTYSTHYYWKVQGYNNAGSGDWCAAAEFFTPAPPPPPPAPTLGAPGAVDGGVVPVIASLKPDFSWDPIVGTTNYRIQISKNTGFSSLAVNATTGSTAAYPMGWSSLAVGTQYWWRVQATNDSGTGGWSSVFTFRTPSVPAAPTLQGPSSGATGIGVRPEFSWLESAGATGYHITVASTSWFGTKLIDRDVTDGSLAYTHTADLSPNVTYYWRVNATNAAGTSGWSSTSLFTTASAQVPTNTPTPTPTTGATPTPTPIGETTPTVTPTVTPTRGTTVSAPVLGLPGVSVGGGDTVPILDTLRPTYSWEPVDGAASYRIQVSRNDGFGWVITNTTTTATNYAVLWSDLTKGVQLWWRVQAINGPVTGPWSDVHTFWTPSVPAAPSPQGPPTGATGVGVRPEFSWLASAGATRYHITVASNSWFGTKLIDTDVTDGSSAYTHNADLSANVTYYWRVNATNAAGTSGWSTTSTFVSSPPSGPTNTPTPTVETTPTLTPTTGGATPTTTPTAIPPTPTATATPTRPASLPAPISTSPGVVAGGTDSVQTLDTLRPTYSWDSVGGASSYRIQVSRNEGFGWLITNTTTSSTNYPVQWSNLPTGVQLWWRVQATAGTLTSGWSDVRTFLTAFTPAVPGSPSPSSGTKVSSLTPTMSWAVVPGATTYRIQLSTTPYFNAKLADTPVTDGSCSYTHPSALAPNTTYYWKVNAGNVAGTSNYSATWSFTTPAN
jgi:hypothetical protein